jgi:Zn-dependent protease
MQTSTMPFITEFLITIIIFLMAITIHEFSHAVMAYFLGDDTAKRSGRLTLNPLAHIDPFGFIFLVFFGFGWAKPVPMDSRNFTYPRLYSVISALAGPFSNLLIAYLFLLGAYHLPTTSVLLGFMKLGAWFNIMLGVFNLFPIPPLDGSHIIEALIPKSWKPGYYSFQRYSIFLLFFLFLLPQTQQLFLLAIQGTLALLQKLIF